ncbi:MAG: hypothetical protein PUB07_04210 [Clostridia bacterium]|nr:hypothetical protein [Clostridia bacterium]
MKLKTRLILNRAITIMLGILIVGMSLIKDIELFFTMGIAMIFCAVIQLIKQRRILSDPNKMKELENMYKDERVRFIAQKSHSFAFWVSVYAEFIGILVSMYFGLENIYHVLNIIVCFQILIYIVANFYFSKKY